MFLQQIQRIVFKGLIYLTNGWPSRCFLPDGDILEFHKIGTKRNKYIFCNSKKKIVLTPSAFSFSSSCQTHTIIAKNFLCCMLWVNLAYSRLKEINIQYYIFLPQLIFRSYTKIYLIVFILHRI